MVLETEWNGDGVLITARGLLDYRTSPCLWAALMEAAARRAREVTVDMTSVGYVDSSVVATLAGARRVLAARGGRVVVSGLSGMLRDVFFLTSAGRMLEYAGPEGLREGA